jgi:hypothetical protein
MQFLGDRGTAKHVTALEHEDLASRFGQVGGADQAVMAAADDDGVIGPGHLDAPPHVVPPIVARLRGGSKNGVLQTVALIE